MSDHDEVRPPLSQEMRSALGVLREEKPSARLRARLGEALVRADDGRACARAAGDVAPGPWRLLLAYPSALALAGLVLGAGLVLLSPPGAAGTRDAEPVPAREVAFRRSGAGERWLELPWSHAVHSGEPATVWLETSPPLDFRPHLTGLPSLALVNCDAARCVHAFTARTGDAATPLRVRIERPGRYELRLSHVSEVRHVQERFVVVVD
ncbi:hypothetical protein LZ198_18860 [Myxococcus sp. K15C18031901]|uniref:hypothetical protein n=1 Tax=Myxococcus dinghuensis TaxID=2906761 RepID=UPI0020A6E20F|nr:hypothetical protein [Myxococcus dinghuensis]MCP3100937.1 hypothetical protein [Myxococcus dinghuensis]